MSVTSTGNSGSSAHSAAPSTSSAAAKPAASSSSGSTGSSSGSGQSTGIPGGDSVHRGASSGSSANAAQSSTGGTGGNAQAAGTNAGASSSESGGANDVQSLVSQLAAFIQSPQQAQSTGAAAAMAGDSASNSGNGAQTAGGAHPSTSGTHPSTGGAQTAAGGAQTATGSGQHPAGSAQSQAHNSANIPAGATNVAGRDQLNLNKPIYVPMRNGDYDSQAIKAIGDQSLRQAGMTQSQAKADHGPHHGNAGRADGSFTIANGYAKGILNGAAAIYGANANGYTSLKDHKYAVTQSAIETGSGQGLNGRQNFKQQHVAAGAGSDGQGPIQLDGKWHDQRNSNMPVVAFTRGYGIARKLGHGNDLKKDGLAYNQGFYGGQGQTVGHEGRPQSYGAYWDKLVNRLNNRPQAAPAVNGATQTHSSTS